MALSSLAAASPALGSSIKILVHVREKTFVVSTGDGGQKIRWLAHVGIARYDERTHGAELGTPRGMRLEDGTRLNMDDIICSRLKSGANVWVLLKEDLITGGRNEEGRPDSARQRSQSPGMYMGR